MKKIKILYDYYLAVKKNKTGIPIFVNNIYKELMKNSFLTVHKSGVLPLYLPSRPYRFFNFFRIFYYTFFLSLRMFFGRYDIYIQNGYFFKPYFIPKRTKIISVIHDIGLILYDDIQSKEQTEYMRESLPISIKNSDLIITVSMSSKKDIEKYLNQIKIQKPVEVVYNAPELKEEAGIELSRFNINSKYFLFLSTLEPRKNPLQMVEGFHNFINTYKSDIKLVCAGQKGWLYDDVMEYIREHKLDDKVIFTGYVNEQEKYWLIKKSVGFLFLSKYEGFGIPPLEALTLGTPILLNDIPVFHELFEDDAIYVNANNVTEVAEGMNKLLTIEKARTCRCLEKFSWEKSGEMFADIIKNFIRRT